MVVIITEVTTDITADRSSSAIRIITAITTTTTITDIRTAVGCIAAQCGQAALIGGVAIATAPTNRRPSIC